MGFEKITAMAVASVLLIGCGANGGTDIAATTSGRAPVPSTTSAHGGGSAVDLKFLPVLTLGPNAGDNCNGSTAPGTTAQATTTSDNAAPATTTTATAFGSEGESGVVRPRGQLATTTTALPTEEGKTTDTPALPETTTPESTSVPGETTAAAPSAAVSRDGTFCYTLGTDGFGGNLIDTAKARQSNGQWVIDVSISKADRRQANLLFNTCYEGSGACPSQGVGRRGSIAVVLDGVVLSAPEVNGPDLALQSITISGDFNKAEATNLAAQLDQ